MLAVIAAGLIVLGLAFLVRALDGWTSARNLPVMGRLSEIAYRQGDDYVVDSPGHMIRVGLREFHDLVDRENVVYGRPGEQLQVGLRTRSGKLFLGTVVLFVTGGCWLFGGLRSSRRSAK